MTTSARTLTLDDLEAAYDRLAQAIDAAGETKAALFLVKLALLNAKALGDVELFTHNIDAALQDL